MNLAPRLTATLELRKASSDCHGARLAPAPGGGYLCQACGQPCSRVLGPPQEVTAHG